MIQKVDVTFEKQSDNSYSCIVDHEFPKFGLIGYGSTARKAEEDVFVGLHEMREQLGEDEVPDIEIMFRKFDVGSFFSYFPFLNITQFAKYIGINPTQMRQYASGIRQPSAQKREQMNVAFRTIAEKLLLASRALSFD